MGKKSAQPLLRKADPSMEGSPRLDGPTLERVMKGDVVYRDAHEVTHRERVKGSRSVIANPFAMYVRSRHLTESQRAAGERLAADYHIAETHRIIALYDERQSTGIREWTDRQAEARHRVTMALASVGTVLAPVLVHVVLLGESARGWAEARGLRGTTAKLFGMRRLRWALDALAKHYGMSPKKDR